MSENNESLLSIYTSEELLFESYERAFKENYWLTNDGRKILFTNMSNNHLKNTIAYLKRNEDWPYQKEFIKKMSDELQYRSSHK